MSCLACTVARLRDAACGKILFVGDHFASSHHPKRRRQNQPLGEPALATTRVRWTPVSVLLLCARTQSEHPQSRSRRLRGRRRWTASRTCAPTSLRAPAPASIRSQVPRPTPFASPCSSKSSPRAGSTTTTSTVRYLQDATPCAGVGWCELAKARDGPRLYLCDFACRTKFEPANLCVLVVGAYLVCFCVCVFGCVRTCLWVGSSSWPRIQAPNQSLKGIIGASAEVALEPAAGET